MSARPGGLRVRFEVDELEFLGYAKDLTSTGLTITAPRVFGKGSVLRGVLFAADGAQIDFDGVVQWMMRPSNIDSGALGEMRVDLTMAPGATYDELLVTQTGPIRIHRGQGSGAAVPDAAPSVGSTDRRAVHEKHEQVMAKLASARETLSDLPSSPLESAVEPGPSTVATQRLRAKRASRSPEEADVAAPRDKGEAVAAKLRDYVDDSDGNE